MCNILPIAWICDAEIFADELDKDFLDGIEPIKKGYAEMYPMLSFKGKLSAKKIIDSEFIPEKKSAMLFSGGVDSYFTLISNIKDKPPLITIWGSDIALDNIIGWENVKKQVINTLKPYSLENTFIKSCFRRFLNERKLDNLVECSKDGWWHGFQHGIGLISHAAPYAYIHKLNTLYIAATFTINDKGTITSASDPTIDNFLKFCGCRVIHDGYEFLRLEKVHKVCEFAEKNNQIIKLRVCWISKEGENCCRCEKCYRTIFALLVEGFDPKKYGFDFPDNALKKMVKDIKKTIILTQSNIMSWENTQKKYLSNKANLIDNKNLSWLEDVNFKKLKNNPKRLLKKLIIKIKSIIISILKGR